MDQSGSRHRTEMTPHSATPLIIDRPDLAHPLARVVAFLVTAAIWCWWLFLWIPAIEIIAAELGHPITFYIQPSAQSTLALHYLLTQFPVALALLTGLLLANVLVGAGFLLLFPKRKTAARRIDQRGAIASVDPAALAEWQCAKILRVEHDQSGCIIGASIHHREVS